jgi:3-oxoacyl-[acyl-carrier protein] reductase
VSELENRVALVTGGSRGIGKAIALAAAGAAVAVNYRERGEASTSTSDRSQRTSFHRWSIRCPSALGADPQLPKPS